ncbi:MAG TPA: amidohydrolase family protein [Alphaproteobacteria bacterium]
MRIIAIEEHFETPMHRARFPYTPRRIRNFADRKQQLGHDLADELLDIGDTRLAAMDAAGISLQVLSLSIPGCQALDAAEAVPMARDANDRMSDTIKVHPGRFAGFAALPTADPAASAAELERAVRRLGFKGAMINGHTQGSFLDDRKYWPIFEAAQALDVPVYLHPRDPHPAVLKAYFEGYEELAFAGWGFAMDTCSHFLRLVFSGVFDAYPRLRMILGHLGEGLPFWLHRLEDHTRGAAKRRGLKRTPAQYLTENLVVTCSGQFSVPAFLCTIMALGVDNVLFSVDWPYESNRVAVKFLNALPVSDVDREKIAHGNAERVLRL